MGGGTIRTAAKIAGIGFGRSGLRGSPAALPTEQMRNASRPSPTVAGVSSQGAKVAEVAPLHTATSRDIWDLGDDGDLVVPRTVFGTVHTFDEAKEATTELKDAIDKIYLSSDSSQCEDSSPGSQVSVLSPPWYEPVTKSCVIEAISPSAPKHAIQACQLLSTSPEAQAVVASIASDPNVCKAVMENPALNIFFQSHQTEEATEKVVELPNGAAIAVCEGMEEILEKVEAKSPSGNGFFDFMGGLMQNIKLTVTDLVSDMSTYLQNTFPTFEKENKSADAEGNTKASFMDNKTFLGLAMLVIMVVLMKRV